MPQDLGLQLGIQPSRADGLAKEVNSEGGFAEVLQTIRALARDVFGHVSSFAGRESSEQE